MKLGVSAFGWTAHFGPSVFSLLPAVREHGLEGFEVPMFDPRDLEIGKIRKALEENDLECTVCAILPPGINPLSSDAAVRRKSQGHLADCIDAAAELGAKLMGGPLYAPIGYLPGRRRNQDEWQWAVECFQGLGGKLDETGMSLALEPVNRSETFFLTTAAEAATLCEAIGHPRIGVLIDTFHSNIEEKSLRRTILSLGPRLRHIHASENDRGTPGSGSVDFPGIVQALREIGYDGYLTIEGLGTASAEEDARTFIWRRTDESGDKIAFDGAAYLRGLLGSRTSNG